MARSLTPAPTSWRIDLHRCFADEAFTRRFGAKVKAVGGRYTHCRGHEEKRFVHVPNTSEGRAVIDALFGADDDKRSNVYCVVAEGLPHSWPSWVVVLDGPFLSSACLDHGLAAHVANAKSRGIALKGAT